MHMRSGVDIFRPRHECSAKRVSIAMKRKKRGGSMCACVDAIFHQPMLYVLMFQR